MAAAVTELRTEVRCGAAEHVKYVEILKIIEVPKIVEVPKYIQALGSVAYKSEPRSCDNGVENERRNEIDESV